MTQFTKLTADGPIRHLLLDAPDRRNALDLPMLREIAEAIRTVADDREARVLVVSGAGKAFCAGADLKTLFGDTSRRPAEIREDLKRVYASFLGIKDLAIPTIAAVGGVAVGAGVNIALACDMVVAGPKARFALTFAEIGLHPGGGSSWFMTRRMGPSRAMLALLGAEVLDAGQAYEAGLATRLADDPLAEAMDLARLYARRDPALVRDLKRAVKMSQTADLDTVLEFESWAQASSVTKPAFQEYMTNFLQ